MCSVRTNGGPVHDVMYAVLPATDPDVAQSGGDVGPRKPVRAQRSGGPDPKPSKRKVKKASLSTLRKKAWMLFSRYIRYYAGACTDAYHRRQCVTCEQWFDPAELHAGHFIHCSKQSRLSYDERNVNCQCRQCNFYGMQGEASIRYTLYMQRVYGPDIVEELLAIKHEKSYMNRGDLESIINAYKWV